MLQQTTKNVLAEILAYKAQEVIQRQQSIPESALRQQIQVCEPHQLEAAFQRKDKNPRLMLEVKPSSPSMGTLQTHLNLEQLIPIYAHYGVAISVLTDSHFFGGSFENLQKVSEFTCLPTLCKDFIISTYQIYEARLKGAHAILLLVKSLSDSQLQEFSNLALQLGMTPLIEVQNEQEVERALNINPSILLINNRNLETLEIDLDTTARLSALIPKSILKVSASGIEHAAHIQALQAYCDGFLMGSALMKIPTEDLAETLRALTA